MPNPNDIVLASDAASVLSAAAFPAIDAHPFYGAFGRKYYPLVFGERRKNESFFVVKDGSPTIYVACSVGEGSLDWYGLPIALFPQRGLGLDEMKTNLASAFNHLDRIMEDADVVHLVIRDDSSKAKPSPVGEECGDRGFQPSVRSSALCDLKLDESEMRNFLRRRTKAPIKWGEKNLRIETFNVQNPSVELFHIYRDFHLSVAGRVTRPDASWQAMFDWIAQGGGDIVFAYIEDRLVSAVMTLDGTMTSYYASGVNDRSLFEKPLSHYPLWLSMLNAKARGKTLYDIGDVPTEGEATPKENNIGFFKRGFASLVANWTCWTKDREDRAGIRNSAIET